MAAMFAAAVTGCGSKTNTDGTITSDNQVTTSIAAEANDSVSLVQLSNISVSDESSDEASFTKRDLSQTADTSNAQNITVSDGETIDITDEGVYVISGTANDCTIRVEADKNAKVQLVLDGVSITNSSFPAIYVVSADKVFITTTDSENTLTVSGQFTSDGETNTDAVIFSKDDLVLNGTGTLNVTSYYGNGITSKDDMKITGGTYNIKSALDAFARHYLQTSQCPRFMPQDDMRARKQFLADLAKEYKADGIIVESNKFCEYWSYERTIDTIVLPRDFGIPVCSIEKEYINGASGQLRTRFQAFVESIEIKKIQEAI